MVELNISHISWLSINLLDKTLLVLPYLYYIKYL